MRRTLALEVRMVSGWFSARRLPAQGTVALVGMCALLAFVLVERTARLEIERARAALHAERARRLQAGAGEIQRRFERIYHALRTVARLPGVRALAGRSGLRGMERGGRARLDPDTRAAVQEIYNDLYDEIRLSEVYLVPRDLDPDAPPGGAPTEPWVTFDEFIVGRTGGHADEEEAHEIPEIEIFEYREMRGQIARLEASHPREPPSLSYPALVSRPVVTCDNSRFDPNHPDDADRTGIVYSVPFYGVDGRFAGLVSAILLLPVVAEWLPDPNLALEAPHLGLALATGGRSAPPEYELRASLDVADAGGPWTISLAVPRGALEASAAYRSAVRARRLGHAIVFVLALAVVALVALSERHRRELDRRAAALEREVARRTEQLRRARDRALAADRAKSAFLANVSHEIRTPMNGIVGMAQLLEQTPLESEQREMLATLRTCGDALLALLDDVLDLSKIEAGKMTLESVEFDPVELFEDALDVVAPRAHDKDLELVLEVDPDVPARLRGDPTRLRQVALNLLSNAVKFTEHGGVALSARTRPEGGRVRLDVAVSDTGVGIPPDHLARIFEPFQQADASTTRRYGGTGLGLALCRELTRLMGGGIEVESEEGRGSTFRFHVSLEAVPAPRPERPLAGRRVLVFDHDRRGLAGALSLLRRLGAETQGVRDGQAAARLAASEPFDDLLLDLRAPGLDGIGVLHEARRLGCGARGFLVASRPVADEELERRACRPDGVILRPLRRRRLVAALSAGSRREKAREAPPPDGTDPAEEPLGLRVLLAEDHPVNARIVARMLGVLGCDVEVAADGERAVEAVARRRFDVVLMDMQMPRLDGLAATRRILERMGQAAPPVVALTANAQTEDAARCREAGMAGFLTKPVRLEQLREALSALHEERTAGAGAAGAP